MSPLNCMAAPATRGIPEFRVQRAGAGLARCLVVVTLLLIGGLAGAETDAPGFEADSQLSVNARRWAEEFVAFAAGRYEVQLDFSEVSIKFLDDIAADIHKTFVEENPPDEMVRPIARALVPNAATRRRVQRAFTTRGVARSRAVSRASRRN